MKKIGIGYEDYKRIIDDGCYYVDKTLLIRDVIEKGGMVTLFTRPRRFGKTLALSMLRTFFELEYDDAGNPVDNSRYFEGKKIMEADKSILSKQGKYPVIKLSLKSAKQPDFLLAALRLRDEIVAEIRRHAYLWQTDLLPKEDRDELAALSRSVINIEFEDEKKQKAEIGRYATALKTLSVCLKKYHGENVIILLDEYDVPLENAYYKGFYNEMIDFVRSLFESCLKTNDVLELGVVTGCLRISRDTEGVPWQSIFTGLNHLEINSVYDSAFEEAFGFTQEETEEMLRDYGISDRIEETKEWYDGYLFGETEIYNPWSIIKYVSNIAVKKKKYPMPFWANTSSNQIVKDLVWHADEERKKELDVLVKGGTIEKKIHEDITYDDIYESEDNLWNFLFFTGYLRKVSERAIGDDTYLTMRIPNKEIESIFRNQISGWFEKQVKDSDRSALYKAVMSDDVDTMADYVSGLLEKSISTFDSAEAFYHGYFLSLLGGMPGYTVQSNREEGDGRPDIVLYPNRPKDPAIIFEVKIRKKFNEMEEGLEEAYEQIRTKRYEEGVLEDGYLGVRSYGICFCRKSCIVGNLVK